MISCTDNLMCYNKKMHSIKYTAKDIALMGNSDFTNVGFEGPESAWGPEQAKLAQKIWIK